MPIREQPLGELSDWNTEVLPETWEVHKSQIQDPGPFVLGKCHNLCGRHAECPPLRIYALGTQRSPQGALALDGLFAALSCTDANDLLHGGNEDLPIANAASLGCSHNCFNDHVFQVVRDNYFYLSFGKKVNDVFCTTIEFSMTALPAKAAHLTHGHTLDARGIELFLHFVQLERFDDCFNLFHDSFSSGVSSPCRPTLPQDGSTDRLCQHYPPSSPVQC